MNDQSPSRVAVSACPHDCPSTCSLEIDLLADGRIGRVRGAAGNNYTAGVICAKVARYAERIHHPDRLTQPLRRTGPKGSGQFVPVDWADALDLITERFLDAEARFGSETVWPYYYAGTMGLVQRDGINRLRHAKRYAGFFSTICVNPAWSGWLAGAGRLSGPDPREMANSDLVVIWGTNAVATQVNVMTHAVRARKERGAKIAVIDVYRTATMDQADLPLLIRPGTDGALACAVMHVLFRDGYADRAWMAEFTDDAVGLEAHLATRTPAWAAELTGLPEAEIVHFAHEIGRTPRSYFRLGYGFSRSRNGAVNMHAASCIPAVTGAWRHEGGGAFHNNGAIYHWDKSLIEGHELRDPTIRPLDQSRIGAVLTGDPTALAGPPVTAMLIQNTNPVAVAPDQTRVRQGFAREDLFVAVHEQFLTETARMADLVLPATMFLEHDDLYQSGGNQFIHFGPKLIEPPGQCRSNHWLIAALAARLGVDHHPGFRMTERELIDTTLQRSGWGTLEALEAAGYQDVQPPFEQAHFLNGFAWPDRRFRFRPDWAAVPLPAPGNFGPVAAMPCFPDHWAVIEAADTEHPFRLVTPPARHFLNSSFTETKGSLSREGRPTLLIHPEDAAALGLTDGDRVEVANTRGAVVLPIRCFDGVRRGVVIAESVWPNAAHEQGRGINTLTGADPVAPFGGAAFHDNRVRLQRAAPLTGRG